VCIFTGNKVYEKSRKLKPVDRDIELYYIRVEFEFQTLCLFI